MAIKVHCYSNDNRFESLEIPPKDWESSFAASAEEFKQRMQRFQEEQCLTLSFALPPQVVERFSILMAQDAVIKSLKATSRRGKRRNRHLIREIEKATIRYIVSGRRCGLPSQADDHQETRQ